MNDLRVKTHAAIILCLAVLSTSVHTQTEKAGYLRENSEIISLKGENDFRLFDEAFYSNQLFMLGEMHGTANSYRIQELLVEKLKEKTNFRVYVLELSHITAQSLNDYLDSGSEAKLDSVFELLKGSFGYSREYRNIFTNIRRINQKAKPADRIRFIGVDKFAGSIGNFEYLKRLLTESRYKKGKSSILDEVFGTTGN